MLKALAATLLSLTVAIGAHAQDLTHKSPPQSGPIAITGGTIHTISGNVIENGYVLFESGMITDVGEGSPVLPRSTRSIDARGMHVYPGLIAANTQTGLIEIDAVRATRDYAEVGSITPEVRAAVAVNPDSMIIPVTRLNGILTAGVFPLGGSIPGRASVIRMDGWTWEDLAIETDAGLVVNWPSLRPVRWRLDTKSADEQREEAMERVRTLTDTFEEAAAYLRAKDADKKIATDLRWEAMRPSILEIGRAHV